MESFSKRLKDQLIAEENKKKCCRNIFSSALNADYSQNGTITSVWQMAKCDHCRNVFMRAMFIEGGSVTDPEKSYHVEFSFASDEQLTELSEILEECGFFFKQTKRKGRYILYLKESSAIEDFLVFIGASQAAFDIMNNKIVKEFRNSVNRQVNCDTANIEKQLAAVKKYTEAIGFLIESGKIDALPEDLRNTALLRYKNDQLSLADLGRLADPPVSKSGMKHRLDKILSIAEAEQNK